MIRLNLTASPEWLELASGMRLLVAPVTPMLMVSARPEPAIETMPEGATQVELALTMAQAVAPMMHLSAFAGAKREQSTSK